MFPSLNQQSSQPSGGSSLFAGLGGTPAGNATPNAGDQAGKRGLFDTGSAGQQQQQPQSRPSPFAGLGSSLSGGSTLLGSGTGTTAAAAPTLSSGLSGFGPAAGASTTNQQQLGTNNTSLFGARATASQPATSGSSMFGGQQQPQEQQQQTQPLSQQQGQQQNQQSFAEKSVSAKQATQPAFFNSLLERGKKRSHANRGENGNFGELPSLQFGLDDIRRKARELGDGSKTPQKGADSKAYGCTFINFYSRLIFGVIMLTLFCVPAILDTTFSLHLGLLLAKHYVI